MGAGLVEEVTIKKLEATTGTESGIGDNCSDQAEQTGLNQKQYFAIDVSDYIPPFPPTILKASKAVRDWCNSTIAGIMNP